MKSVCISTELSDDMIVIYIFMKKIEFTVRKALKYPFLYEGMGIDLPNLWLYTRNGD